MSTYDPGGGGHDVTAVPLQARQLILQCTESCTLNGVRRQMLLSTCQTGGTLATCRQRAPQQQLRGRR